MLSDMSGVQVSTAAENVCRRQTHATVGSPVGSKVKKKYWQQTNCTYNVIKLTRKDMFVDPGQLYIGLGRVGDNQTIDNPFWNCFRHRMPQIALQLHCRCINPPSIKATNDIIQNSSAYVLRWSWRVSDNVCCPSIDKFVKLRSGILI